MDLSGDFFCEMHGDCKGIPGPLLGIVERGGLGFRGCMLRNTYLSTLAGPQGGTNLSSRL